MAEADAQPGREDPPEVVASEILFLHATARDCKLFHSCTGIVQWLRHEVHISCILFLFCLRKLYDMCFVLLLWGRAWLTAWGRGGVGAVGVVTPATWGQASESSGVGHGRRWRTGGAGEELAAPPNRNHGCGLTCKHSERKAGVILEYKLDSSTECHSSVMSVFHNGKTANLICTMAK